MTTTHSLARLMYDTNAALDAAERELRVADYADPAVSATIDALSAAHAEILRLDGVVTPEIMGEVLWNLRRVLGVTP